MNYILDKDILTAEDIRALITNNLEEGITIEFKRAGALGKSDRKKNEISKDVSAFANSAGGIIFYGIAEEDHVASSLDFVDGTEITKEWLEQVINSRIHRRIPNIGIIPIRFDNNLSETIYVVKIPSSPLSPHMAADNKYYRRYNFESIPMDEYEVRVLYYNKQQTIIDILSPEIKIHDGPSGGGKVSFYRVEVNILLKNIGYTFEEKYKLNLEIPKSIIELSQNTSNISKYLNRYEGEIGVYSISSTETLFQNETIKFVKFNILMNIKNLPEYSKKMIKAQLLFSGGIVERVIDLDEEVLKKVEIQRLRLF